MIANLAHAASDSVDAEPTAAGIVSGDYIDLARQDDRMIPRQPK
jgi:hypothetical protein